MTSKFILPISFQNFMTLPVEKMKLSDKELNCMKMCQKAPKCADFSINPGEACPRPPYPRLAPTELAFMHSVNQNTHINSQTRCYDPEYRLELFSVCESVPPPPRPSMASRFLRSHENISCFKYCPPPPPNMESWMRPCGSIATVSNIWDPDQARRFVWSDLGPTCQQRLLFCGLHHWYHTEFLAADIVRLVFSRRINKLKLKVGALI